MVLKNEDIELIIKMENLIGMNEKKLFGKNGDKKCIVKWYDNTETIITKDDFLDFMCLIERVIKNKKKASEKANNYNKKNKEYHNLMNKLCGARKSGNVENIEKYSKMLEDLKKNKNI